MVVPEEKLWYVPSKRCHLILGWNAFLDWLFAVRSPIVIVALAALTVLVDVNLAPDFLIHAVLTAAACVSHPFIFQYVLKSDQSTTYFLLIY